MLARQRLRLSQFFNRNRRLCYSGLVAFAILVVFLAPASFVWARQFGSAPTGLFGLPLFDGGSGEDGQISSEDIAKDSAQGIPLPEPWDGAERVTLLLIGLDYRDWSNETSTASRSDTMILLTIDPVAKTAGILSVPRDLWAVIPGFSPNKINTAYYFGELYKVPGGGPALAMRTVEQVIGVPIDYYAQIDFEAFERFIDLIDGVKIDVPYAITVDPLGSDTNPKNLKPGVQLLPGNVALAYARERKSQGGDFGRAERQQQIIIGIRDRILDFNLLPGLVANASQIYNELSDGIHTNLSLNDALRLAVLASQIEKEDIRQGVIGEKYITYGRSPDDLAILIPIPDKIRELRDEIFTSNTALGPLTGGTPEERFAIEGARISLQNGTQSGDIASATQTYLQGLGANIVEANNAERAYSDTIIIDHSGNPYTLAFLAELFDLPSRAIIHDFIPNSSIDVEIKLGADWIANNSLP
jgi:LCP family protein required for cell wall assembly